MISSAQRLKRALLAACLAATTVIAAEDVRAEDLALKEAASMTGVVLWLSSGAPGLVLAVVRGEHRRASLRRDAPPAARPTNGRSHPRMGSIAKAMAGHVLASMAADGTVKLTDPLVKYAPAGAKVPAFAGQQITLLDLATHTAGLPRELPGAPEPPPGQNPFTGFQSPTPIGVGSPAQRCRTRRARARCIRNLGFGLLGEALAKAGGKPYSVL